MSRILALKSSILGEHSQSSQLLDQYLTQFDAQDVTLRDLALEPLPMLDSEVISALNTQEPSLAQQQIRHLSNRLIHEVNEAELLVIAAPMYNFTISTQLKNWFDLITRAGITFKYTEQGPQGLIKNTKAVVISTRGGQHLGTATDNITPYLTTILGFIGITDVEFVYAEALNMGQDLAQQALINAQTELTRLAS